MDKAKLKIVVVIIILLKSFSFCFGQASESKLEKDYLLNGLYLENKEVLIPWQINFAEIEKYGNPKISKSTYHKNWMIIKWDSVTIFNGIFLSLQIEKPRKIVKRNHNQRTPTILSFTDSSTSERIIKFLRNYTQKKGQQIISRNNSYKRWTINDRRMFVGNSKNNSFVFWTE